MDQWRFRRLLDGQDPVLGRTGISGVVLPVLVYDRTGSPTLTSLLAAVEALPYLAFGLLAGAVAGCGGAG